MAGVSLCTRALIGWRLWSHLNRKVCWSEDRPHSQHKYQLLFQLVVGHLSSTLTGVKSLSETGGGFADGSVDNVEFSGSGAAGSETDGEDGDAD